MKTHIERLNTENEKKSFVYSEQRSDGKQKVHLSVLLIRLRPPAWMFLAGENKQLKAASVIQDTKENIVKHVSGETVLEKFYFTRCQTKHMIIKCYEDSVNFQLGTLFKTHF